jgi:hypothetical protein
MQLVLEPYFESQRLRAMVAFLDQVPTFEFENTFDDRVSSASLKLTHLSVGELRFECACVVRAGEPAWVFEIEVPVARLFYLDETPLPPEYRPPDEVDFDGPLVGGFTLLPPDLRIRTLSGEDFAVDITRVWFEVLLPYDNYPSVPGDDIPEMPMRFVLQGARGERNALLFFITAMSLDDNEASEPTPQKIKITTQ